MTDAEKFVRDRFPDAQICKCARDKGWFRMHSGLQIEW